MATKLSELVEVYEENGELRGELSVVPVYQNQKGEPTSGLSLEDDVAQDTEANDFLKDHGYDVLGNKREVVVNNNTSTNEIQSLYLKYFSKKP